MEPGTARECLVCGRQVEQSDGIQLLHHFLCHECEEAMVSTSVDDDHYAYFVERLRALWFDLVAQRAILGLWTNAWTGQKHPY